MQQLSHQRKAEAVLYHLQWGDTSYENALVEKWQPSYQHVAVSTTAKQVATGADPEDTTKHERGRITKRLDSSLPISTGYKTIDRIDGETL